jgi:hypothetical protein
VVIDGIVVERVAGPPIVHKESSTAPSVIMAYWRLSRSFCCFISESSSETCFLANAIFVRSSCDICIIGGCINNHDIYVLD